MAAPPSTSRTTAKPRRRDNRPATTRRIQKNGVPFQNVTRNVSRAVSNRLWGRAAGRCEFDGCNRPLWRSPVTGEPVNIAERAHIYSFSKDGPRGNAGVAPSLLNDASNLILVCGPCHKTIDRDKDGARYTPELLRSWKASHEARVELVTGFNPDKQSHVVLYGANIGHHSAPLSAAATMPALFPHRYPTSERPIQLGMINSSWEDRNPEFWNIEAKNLLRQHAEKVRPLIARGDATHLSVFGLAPQPLLTLLGAQLTDIAAVDVYPLLREPQGWRWDDEAPDIEYRITEPPRASGPAALVLSLSATVTPDRITSVLGADAAIWELSVPHRHNDAIRARRHLRGFRQVIRPLLDRIKAAHGQREVLHIFPAASVTAAIELGRIRMPKADMPWKIYDQVNARGGFVHALCIPFEESE